MIITKTMFHLYLIRSKVCLMGEIDQSNDGFRADIIFEKDLKFDSKMFSDSKEKEFTNGKEIFIHYKKKSVFLSYQDIKENELIKSKFFI